jgi:hypothetical protein
MLLRELKQASRTCTLKPHKMVHRLELTLSIVCLRTTSLVGNVFFLLIHDIFVHIPSLRLYILTPAFTIFAVIII